MARLGTDTLLTALLVAVARPAGASQWTNRIRTAADFLLEQQAHHGCIPDAPGALRANTDSNMQYALLALAHAYQATHSDRFRRGLRDGIQWLAARMETRQKEWVGSWRYAYAAKPPYVALPTSPGEGVVDARGVSATCALFPYLVALYTELTQTTTLARKHQAHCRAALDFVLQRNLASNDLFYNAWHRHHGDGPWSLHRTQYAADQADVYLGLRAGQYLLSSRRYTVAASKLERAIERLLYDEHRRAFVTALDAKGQRAPPKENWQSHFAQGYLAWAFGSSDETRAGLKWLRDRQAPDGSFRRKASDVPYTLSAAAFCLASSRLKDYATWRRRSKRWLRDTAITAKGGIRDFAHAQAPVYNNLAGWVVAAFASAHPFPTVAPPDPNDPYRAYYRGWHPYWYYRIRR